MEHKFTELLGKTIRLLIWKMGNFGIGKLIYLLVPLLEKIEYYIQF